MRATSASGSSSAAFGFPHGFELASDAIFSATHLLQILMRSLSVKCSERYEEIVQTALTIASVCGTAVMSRLERSGFARFERPAIECTLPATAEGSVGSFALAKNARRVPSARVSV